MLKPPLYRLINKNIWLGLKGPWAISASVSILGVKTYG